MLVELHNQGQDRFVYTCNECKHHVETRWHCTVCEVGKSGISQLCFEIILNLNLDLTIIWSSFHINRTTTYALIATTLKAMSTRW